MTTFDVRVERGEKYWLVHVPDLDRTTQARTLREVEPMARDLIAVMRDVRASSVKLNVDYHWPTEAMVHWQAAHRLRAESDARKAEAAAEARAAAAALAALGLTLREIGEILDVSHQRAAQLVGSK